MPSPQPARRRGCWFYGCLTLLVLGLVAVGVAFFGLRYAVRTAVARYTEDHPVPLPKAEISGPELQSLQDRVERFQRGLDKPEGIEPLRLSSRELQALVATLPQLAAWKDEISASIQDDQIRGEVSISLDRFGRRALKGRYLNGRAAFKVALDRGRLHVTLEELRVKGHPVPESAMSYLRRENLAKDVDRDPRSAEWLRKLDRIELKDSQLTVQPAASR